MLLANICELQPLGLPAYIATQTEVDKKSSRDGSWRPLFLEEGRDKKLETSPISGTRKGKGFFVCFVL